MQVGDSVMVPVSGKASSFDTPQIVMENHGGCRMLVNAAGVEGRLVSLTQVAKKRRDRVCRKLGQHALYVVCYSGDLWLGSTVWSL